MLTTAINAAATHGADRAGRFWFFHCFCPMFLTRLLTENHTLQQGWIIQPAFWPAYGMFLGQGFMLAFNLTDVHGTGVGPAAVAVGRAAIIWWFIRAISIT